MTTGRVVITTKGNDHTDNVVDVRKDDGGESATTDTHDTSTSPFQSRYSKCISCCKFRSAKVLSSNSEDEADATRSTKQLRIFLFASADEVDAECDLGVNGSTSSLQ